MLIRDAELEGAITRVRIENGVVSAIGADLAAKPGEVVLDARGGALLPGLHDHHIHLLALAAALDSLPCGPPRVNSAESLQNALRERAASLRPSGGGWLRGIGYHDSVAGAMDRDWLDRVVPDLPVRIQHRSGRLWVCNSAALDRLGDGPWELVDGRPSGRLYDADTWMRQRLGSMPPDIGRASRLLAGFGITGITEVTPHNNLETARLLVGAQARGELLQDVYLMGDANLDALRDTKRLRRGPRKIHLHETALPDFAGLCGDVAASHACGRAVAIHCVTLTELMFALHVLESAGAHRGDRIEHAGVAPPEVLEPMRRLGVTVVTQPNFIRERGDQYLAEVDPRDQPWLYRLRGLLAAGIPVAAGSDAPFGEPNPWLLMQAAVERRTRNGHCLGIDETVGPERALALLCGALDEPGGASRVVAVGVSADLCLLDRSWAGARGNLGGVKVVATFGRGELIFDGF